ncbi:hypothetical protein ACSBR1_040873 [Camellia fascicularis]
MNQLGGQISPSLPDLNHLYYLDLSMNDMQISNSLGSLKSLRYLDLSWSIFNATIPHHLGNLSRLQYLNLSNNYLRGPICDTLGRLTSLTILDLSINDFDDSMFNSFYGPLPSSLGTLSYLRVLDAGNNQLNGSIPVSLGQLSKLEYLDLSNNAFVSTIFELHFAKLKSLNELYLHSNSLVLNVTSQWVPPFQLQVIQLSSIKVGPQFPQWLGTQKNVTQLDMSNASISDVIPDWFEIIRKNSSLLGAVGSVVSARFDE